MQPHGRHNQPCGHFVSRALILLPNSTFVVFYFIFHLESFSYEWEKIYGTKLRWQYGIENIYSTNYKEQNHWSFHPREIKFTIISSFIIDQPIRTTSNSYESDSIYYIGIESIIWSSILKPFPIVSKNNTVCPHQSSKDYIL